MSDRHECAGGETLIFACSGRRTWGASAIGREADDTGRHRQDVLLAGVGGRVEGIVQKTRAASRIVAIDGCSLDCAKKCLDQVGISRFQHLRVTDLGMEKGQTPVNDENITATARAASALLA
jgi:uncharacterized metal-binding protein